MAKDWILKDWRINATFVGPTKDKAEIDRLKAELAEAQRENERLQRINKFLLELLRRTDVGERIEAFAYIIFSDDETFEAWLGEETGESK